MQATVPAGDYAVSALDGSLLAAVERKSLARAANPGGRIPRRRSLADAVTIAVDTRERYPYRFAQ